MRISDWSSDVCSSDLGDDRDQVDGPLQIVGGDLAELLAQLLSALVRDGGRGAARRRRAGRSGAGLRAGGRPQPHCGRDAGQHKGRSEEHTSELQSLMRISYAVVCCQKKTIIQQENTDYD